MFDRYKCLRNVILYPRHCLNMFYISHNKLRPKGMSKGGEQGEKQEFLVAPGKTFLDFGA